MSLSIRQLTHSALWILSFFLLSTCNLGGARFPAGNDAYIESDEPVAFARIKLSTIESALQEILAESSMVKSLNRFEMDPATRILNIKLTLDYPLENLFNFTQIPDNDLSNLHEIELAVSFPETKTLAATRYLSLTFHKFKIDGDDYIDAFEIVAAVTQTILANSSLVDYLYKKNADALPSKDYRVILKEILDQNGIVVFHTTRKINFKLDLSQVAHLSPYVAEYQNLRLWRFSPSLSERNEVRFKIIAGEGKPTDKWLLSQQSEISEDTRTLLQVRNELYQEFSDIENLTISNQNYLNQLLADERIDRKKLPRNYQNEIKQLLADLKQQGLKLLSRQNENFIADPEYEYIQFSEFSKNKMRLFIGDLDRRLAIDKSIQQGGDLNSTKKPLVTKMVSQDLLNQAMNFLTDIEVDGNQLFTQAEIWLMPQLPGVALKGKLHLPLDYLMGLMSKDLQGQDYQSKITDSSGGYPVELILESRVADKGVLSLDIKKFTIKSGRKKLQFDRNSNNKNFLIDLTKLYIANSLAALKLDSTAAPEDEDQAAKEQGLKIIRYLSELKSQYNRLPQKQLDQIILKDILFNPFSSAGEEHLLRKKEILLGQVFSFNPQTKLFEMRLDPDIVMDRINKVKHNLQVWNISPLYSRELNNTFLELAVGDGLRSQKYIDELYFRAGRAENSQFSGIYYEFGNESSAVDLLFSLNFKYLEAYINRFLAEMVKENGIDIEAQAKKDKGETFYEIQHLDLNITPDEKFVLDLKIKSAQYARTWRRAFLGRELKTDIYSISSELKLENKTVTLGKNTHLSQLKYFPQAISVIPTNVNIKSGSPSLINRALTSLISRGTNFILNSSSFKKLLLKIVNKALMGMYQSKDNPLFGHPIEQIARLETTDQDLLIFLNPKLAGAAFDLHLTAEGDRIDKSIKLDAINQMLHVAFTASTAMAKNDKKTLMNLIQQTEELMRDVKKASSKQQLIDLLKDHQLVGRLLSNSDQEKMSLYNRFLTILRKYPQVLNTVNIPHANELEKTRLSSTGSELMYFAAVSYKIKNDLALLLKKMRQYELTSKNLYFGTFEESYQMLERNVYQPLIAQYLKQHHRINKTILTQPISYWTYQNYPDSFVAEEIFNVIKE